MTGTITGVHPVIAAVLYSFEHARQDLRKWAGSLSEEQLWRKTGDIAPVGFQIRHIAGSVDRLITYAAGNGLTDAQLQRLAQESDPVPEVFVELEDALRRASETARQFNPAEFDDVRKIGRKQIPVPLGVLLVHIAEHTQRHVGEAIITVKALRYSK